MKPIKQNRRGLNGNMERILSTLNGLSVLKSTICISCRYSQLSDIHKLLTNFMTYGAQRCNTAFTSLSNAITTLQFLQHI